MFFNKNKNSHYKEIEKALTLIQKKILWLQENKGISTVLLAGHDNKSINTLSEMLFQKLTEDHSRSFLLVNLNDCSTKAEDMDWDHDLVIAYCNDLVSSPAVYSFSNYIDSAIVLIEAGHTSRHAVKEMIQTLHAVKVSVCGAILHGFKEKIPSILNKVFS